MYMLQVLLTFEYVLLFMDRLCLICTTKLPNSGGRKMTRCRDLRNIEKRR